MARTALSKQTTYGTLVSNLRQEGRITTTGYSLFTDAYFYKVISLVVCRWAKVLVDANKPFYRDKENLTLLLSENPYYADTSQMNPYWDRVVRLTHVTSGNTRTIINLHTVKDAESFARLTNVQASTINASQLGWGFQLYFGSNITVTTASDVIEFEFDSQPIIASASSGTYLDIPDVIVPFVKETIIDLLNKYKMLIPEGGNIIQISAEKEKQALALLG